MHIYRHRATVTATSNSASTVTLNVVGALCRQLLVRSNTSSTVFRTQVRDDSNLVIRNYGYHKGELNDMDISLAMAGSYSIQLVDLSVNDTFSVYLAFQE